MQIMGGEGYMTENEIERIFRDSRINLIVEGANEVMQSFIFAYGGKQLAENMLGIQQAVGWDHHDSPTHNLARIFAASSTRPWSKPPRRSARSFTSAFGPPRRISPICTNRSARHADRLCELVREHSHRFKMASNITASRS